MNVSERDHYILNPNKKKHLIDLHFKCFGNSSKIDNNDNEIVLHNVNKYIEKTFYVSENDTIDENYYYNQEIKKMGMTVKHFYPVKKINKNDDNDILYAMFPLEFMIKVSDQNKLDITTNDVIVI
jgi:hypothetical protein